MNLDMIDFYLFSGTGNTLLVAERMAEVFAENGVETRLHRIETADAREMDPAHTIGLAFPVAAQCTYPVVLDFIRRMPKAEGTKVFMVDTLAAFSGGIVGPLRKLLVSKGYQPIGAMEITMPSNWLPGKIDADKDSRKRARGLEKAAAYAAAVLEGESHWGRIPILSDLMWLLGTSSFLWKILSKKGRLFAVDREKCTQCGICVKLCPVGNVTMDEYPVFHDRCQQCMRCIAFCPSEAIHVPNKKYQIYRAVEVQRLLKCGAKTTAGESAPPDTAESEQEESQERTI